MQAALIPFQGRRYNFTPFSKKLAEDYHDLTRKEGALTFGFNDSNFQSFQAVNLIILEDTKYCRVGICEYTYKGRNE